MKIKFIKPAMPLGFAYAEGEQLDCLEPFGKELINSGFAIEVDNVQGALPADMPGREALIIAGFDSLDAVKECTELTEIKGIGKATAENIVAYIAALDAK